MISPAQKAEIYRGIRAVLAQHYIDIGRLSIVVTATGVRLGGELSRLPGMPTPLNPDLVESLMARLRRIPRMPRVQTDFSNWRSEHGGRWVELAPAASERKAGSAAPLKTLKIDVREDAGTEGGSPAPGVATENG